ncbi:hypothetical protein Pfo_019489 [Paulownia fortunei]|nr:hypothetical protein Pfo_019489 [Paulownia fortunei]
MNNIIPHSHSHLDFHIRSFFDVYVLKTIRKSHPRLIVHSFGALVPLPYLPERSFLGQILLSGISRFRPVFERLKVQ